MEYAWQRQLHGAVLSYLRIREDRFYILEQRGDEKAFVTARGWEDLSELLSLLFIAPSGALDSLVPFRVV